MGLGEGPALDIREGSVGSHVITYSLTEDQQRKMALLFKDRAKRAPKKVKKPKKAAVAKKVIAVKKVVIPSSAPLPEIKG